MIWPIGVCRVVVGLGVCVSHIFKAFANSRCPELLLHSKHYSTVIIWDIFVICIWDTTVFSAGESLKLVLDEVCEQHHFFQDFSTRSVFCARGAQIKGAPMLRPCLCSPMVSVKI